MRLQFTCKKYVDYGGTLAVTVSDEDLYRAITANAKGMEKLIFLHNKSKNNKKM